VVKTAVTCKVIFVYLSAVLYRNVVIVDEF